MSHRFLRDLYESFDPAVGPGIVKDPGNGGNIKFNQNFQICEMTSGASGETRTLDNPDRPGIHCAIRLMTDGGGDVVLTAANGLNASLDTVATFADAGDFLPLLSVTQSAGSYRWEINEGNVGTVISSSSPSSTPSSSVSSSPSSSPSAT